MDQIAAGSVLPFRRRWEGVYSYTNTHTNFFSEILVRCIGDRGKEVLSVDMKFLEGMGKERDLGLRVAKGP